MTQAQNPRTLPRTVASKHGRRVPAVLLGLVVITLTALGSTPALADRAQVIYCDGHGGAYGPAHYRDHADGYVLSVTNGYRYYPRGMYGTLALNHYGAPAVYVSGGYFYPLRIGYGPIYEPSGYFEIHAARYGRTSLGLRIGIGALPTIGFGFLTYQPRAVHYSVPRWHYRGDYVRYRSAPHIHHNRHRHHVADQHPPRRHRVADVRHDTPRYKWQKSVRHEHKQKARGHDQGRRKRGSSGKKFLRFD